ncbi:hypothetical protein [Bradyrhizobium sp. AZCC 2289]|uniref:hypothetical protein n=1 Tax=Bradyrhizobium sp. AZCC 2289 TaxID=3117026 RepID=UPI002FF21A55
MDAATGKRGRDTERTGAPHAFWAAAARLVLPLLSLIVSGCSIHPVQQDVTGVPPVDIIHHIRCETRLAIEDKAIELLLAYKGGQHEPSINLAKSLQTQRGQVWKFDPRILTTQEERAFYNRYIRTGIAYDFTLDITEDNKAALLADPVRLITNGVAGIGVGASGEFSRNNARRFIMSDTFAKLLADDHLVCGSEGVENFVYPIAGRIGIRELISTFIDLNEDKSLQTLDSGNSRVFADTMTFLTTLTGSVSPHVEIAPVGSQWGVASPTSFSAFAQRIDKHMVTIGLSMDISKGVAGAAVLPLAVGRSALQKSNVVSPAEQSALDAVRQAKLDAYLERATH